MVMDNEKAVIMAEILKALAHPARVILVDALAKGDMCVCELNRLVELDQSNISRHLAQLKRAGILSEYRDGRKIMHHLECPCILNALECSSEVFKTTFKKRQKKLRDFA